MTAVLRRNQSQAFSPSALALELLIRGISQRLQEARSIGILNDKMLTELQEVYDETKEPDWDGFGALPITSRVRSNAESFLKVLPLGSPRPSVGAEPDGYMTLEWYKDSRMTLSASIGVDGLVHFASIQNEITENGSFPISDTIPEGFKSLVQQFEA